MRNAEGAVRGTGVVCPPLAERLLDTYLTWMVRTGYPDRGQAPNARIDRSASNG